MDPFTEFEIIVSGWKVVFEHKRNIIFQGAFKRKYFIWGPLEFKSSDANVSAFFKIEHPKLFSSNVKIKVQPSDAEPLEISYVWKQPHARAYLNERSFFLMIVHNGSIASLFKDDLQIGSLKASRAPFVGSKYTLKLRADQPIESIKWFLLGLICKNDITTINDDEDPTMFDIGSLQSELQPFDAYWRQK